MILQGGAGAGLPSSMFMALFAILCATLFIGITGAVGSGEIDTSALVLCAICLKDAYKDT